MQKHQFQKQIIVKSILVVTAVFLAMTAVFSGYIIHTGGKAFEEQVDVQLRGITSQLDNTLRFADNIALQIGANHLIIETFGEVEGLCFETAYDVLSVKEKFFKQNQPV